MGEAQLWGARSQISILKDFRESAEFPKSLNIYTKVYSLLPRENNSSFKTPKSQLLRKSNTEVIRFQISHLAPQA